MGVSAPAVHVVLCNLTILLLSLSATLLSATNVHHHSSSSLSPIHNNSLTDVENQCVYTIYVRTSTWFKAGTDSIISVALYDETGGGVLIKNLETWGGVMEEGHDYYERGNLDIFTGRGPCLDKPVCHMELISDGSGKGHGWYCNYVEVTTTGPHVDCHQQLFTVEQWLALDRSPHELTAVRDECPDSTSPAQFTSKNLVPLENLLASS